MTVEKHFSVVVEMADGATKSLPAKGQSSSDVFRQIRETPGVRRVGRVAEVSQAAFERLERGEQPTREDGRPGPMREEREHRGRPEREPKADSRPAATEPDRSVGHVISGPRMVVYTPPGSGERPFKHLKPPPERAKPAVPPAVEQKAPSGAALSPAKRAGGGVADTRLVKSRRRDGSPYLVQRGHWQSAGDKRTFVVTSETGFDTREDAERFLKPA